MHDTTMRKKLKLKWKCENDIEILYNKRTHSSTNSINVRTDISTMENALNGEKCNLFGEFFYLYPLSLSFFLYLPIQFSFSFVAAHAILTWFIDPACVRYVCFSYHCTFFPVFSFSRDSKLWQNIIHTVSCFQ